MPVPHSTAIGIYNLFADKLLNSNAVLKGHEADLGSHSHHAILLKDGSEQLALVLILEVELHRY